MTSLVDMVWLQRTSNTTAQNLYRYKVFTVTLHSNMQTVCHCDTEASCGSVLRNLQCSKSSVGSLKGMQPVVTGLYLMYDALLRNTFKFIHCDVNQGRDVYILSWFPPPRAATSFLCVFFVLGRWRSLCWWSIIFFFNKSIWNQRKKNKAKSEVQNNQREVIKMTAT